ncbi:MAG: hypothetical protein IPP17_14805 [Bacteroidetes bacterium]|nr:hypothetical protein [Bacteroidota bacterium]
MREKAATCCVILTIVPYATPLETGLCHQEMRSNKKHKLLAIKLQYSKKLMCGHGLEVNFLANEEHLYPGSQG